jgi:ActR/RegA family two-component response regulator
LRERGFDLYTALDLAQAVQIAQQPSPEHGLLDLRFGRD